MKQVVVPIALILFATAVVVDLGRRSAAPPAPRYSCRDLLAPGDGRAEGAALNNLGQVVGVAFNAGGRPRSAFLHDGERLIDLGAKLDWTQSWAHDIDDAGRIVGDAYLRTKWGPHCRAFLLDSSTGRLRYPGLAANSGVSAIPRTRVPVSAFARAVGGGGEVVGMTRFSNRTPVPRACLWDAAGPTDLGTFGGLSSAARAINRSGWIVGEAQTAKSEQRAFLWIGGTLQDLGTLGGSDSAAHDLNDHGEVVGEATGDGVGGHAFVWRRGRMRDLGVLPGGSYSSAYGINNAGRIVGASNVPYDRALQVAFARSLERLRPEEALPDLHERAVLWEAGSIYDLNELCDAPGVLLLNARAINERGQIVANGLTGQGQIHPFLLTPIGTGRR